MKKKFTYPEMDISVFDTEDMITTSGITGHSVDPTEVSSQTNAVANVTLESLNIFF